MHTYSARERIVANGSARTAAVAFAGITSLLFAGAGAAVADDAATPALGPGMRVRVTAPGLKTPAVAGTIRSLDDDAITLSADGTPEAIRIPRQRIARLQVSDGRHSRLVGALIGGLAGGALGAIVGKVSAPKHEFLSGADAIGGALIGGLLGTGVGALVPPGERWKEIPVSRYRLTLAPQLDRQAGVKFAVVF